MVNSKKASKQRLSIYNAKPHEKQNLLSAHLSKELAKKYSRRSIKIRAGDKVKILRGDFKKKTGKITEVNYRLMKVKVEGIEKIKKDGTKVMPLIHPSNLIVTELQLDDRKRKKIIERKKTKQ